MCLSKIKSAAEIPKTKREFCVCVWWKVAEGGGGGGLTGGGGGAQYYMFLY